MSQDEMESLFALAAYAPVRSDNVVVEASRAPASPVQFGARFINSGSDTPVSVASDNDEPTLHHFQHLTEDRCDRINRLVRLATALKLSYAETDQIVCAAIEAERRAAISQETASEAPLWMTANTIRALGVFQFLRERFSCGAEDFSALLSDMSILQVAIPSAISIGCSMQRRPRRWCSMMRHSAWAARMSRANARSISCAKGWGSIWRPSATCRAWSCRGKASRLSHALCRRSARSTASPCWPGCCRSLPSNCCRCSKY